MRGFAVQELTARELAARELAARRRQHGATAIEFAFVLPIMFVLFYGALTYGLIFLMRMSLQHAAEDGARSALSYPVLSCADALGHGCSASEEEQHQYVARLTAARNTALTQARWMRPASGASPLAVTAYICPAGIDCADPANAGTTLSCASDDCVPGAPPTCGIDFASSCQIVVNVTYDYAARPFVPQALGFGLITPDRLGAQARLLLEGRMLAS